MIEAPVNSCDRRAYSASVAVVVKEVVVRFAAFSHFFALLQTAIHCATGVVVDWHDPHAEGTRPGRQPIRQCEEGMIRPRFRARGR